MKTSTITSAPPRTSSRLPPPCVLPRLKHFDYRFLDFKKKARGFFYAILLPWQRNGRGAARSASARLPRSQYSSGGLLPGGTRYRCPASVTIAAATARGTRSPKGYFAAYKCNFRGLFPAESDRRRRRRPLLPGRKPGRDPGAAIAGAT